MPFSNGNIFSFICWNNYDEKVNPQQGPAAEDVHLDLPDSVQLHIFNYLDRNSQQNLRKISSSARKLIEKHHGIHVVIPARNWSYFMGLPSFVQTESQEEYVTDSVIQQIILEMESKKIRTLEMTEMPPFFTPFPFDTLIQFPSRLWHVKLCYLDVQLIHDILTKCVNLRTLEYTSSLWRYIPSGTIFSLFLNISFQTVPGPAVNTAFRQKINAFKVYNHPIRLASLRKLSLKIDRLSYENLSDWGNVIFILLALPVLPSLHKFNFIFCNELQWTNRIYLMIISCVGDFLRKTPNLKEFQYHSTCKLAHRNWMFSRLNETLCTLIYQYGSDLLKEVEEASRFRESWQTFFILAERILTSAAQSLEHLQDLDLKFREDQEHQLFSVFVSHLPHNTKLARCKLTDLSSVYEEPNVKRENVYKLFLLPKLESGKRMTVYQSITCLKLHLTCSRIQPTSLTKVLACLRGLKELEISQPFVSDLVKRNHWYHKSVHNELDLKDNPEDPSIFYTLEKLSLQNIDIPFARFSVLCQWRKLREISILNDDLDEGTVQRLRAKSLLLVLASLPKLEIAHLKPVLVVTPAPDQQDELLQNHQRMKDLFAQEERARIALEGLGKLVTTSKFFLEPTEGEPHMTRVAHYYDFICTAAD